MRDSGKIDEEVVCFLRMLVLRFLADLSVSALVLLPRGFCQLPTRARVVMWQNGSEAGWSGDGKRPTEEQNVPFPLYSQIQAQNRAAKTRSQKARRRA